jgi:hypothetical protein
MYTQDLRLGIPTLLANPKLIMALRWVTTQINNVAKVHGSHFKKEVFSITPTLLQRCHLQRNAIPMVYERDS